MSLVRVANDLDNKNIDNLRTLADTCLMQVAPKPLQKSAQIIPIMGAVSALLGGLYLQQHLPMINEGFEKNHQKLVAEIDDMLSSNSDWGVGNQYKGQFTNMLQDFKTKLTSFYNQYKKSESVISELEKPKTAKELMEQAKQPETNSVMEAYKSLKDAFKEIIPYIGTIQKDFASESYKVKQIEDKGFFSDLLDKTQVLHGGKGLVADDFDDVARAIPPYMKSLNEMLGVLKGAESIQKDVQERLSAAEAKSEELFGNQSGNATPAQDVDKEVSQLEADLG
jgi:chromosome segregation ATPase